MKRYTPAEDAELIRLRGDGFSYKAIARILNRTSPSIHRRVERLGMTHRRTAEGTVMSISMSDGLAERLRAAAGHRSMSGYVRRLIERDLALRSASASD